MINFSPSAPRSCCMGGHQLMQIFSRTWLAVHRNRNLLTDGLRQEAATTLMGRLPSVSGADRAQDSRHVSIIWLHNCTYLPVMPYRTTEVRTNATKGAPIIFSGGGGIFFHIKWPVWYEKSTLRNLFTMLQASSVLPHSKRLKNRLKKCKLRNLPEEPWKCSVFQVARGGGGLLAPPPLVGAPLNATSVGCLAPETIHAKYKYSD